MVMFGVEAYDSITWYGEHEQAVLLTELLFKVHKQSMQDRKNAAVQIRRNIYSVRS